MNGQHTPGPWAFDGESRIDAVALRKPTGHMVKLEDGTEKEYIGGLVALPYGCRAEGDYTQNQRANALLIAAAPELLVALQCASNILFLLSDEVEALGLHAAEVPQQISDAIARATGAAA